ncbi:damage-inducible protein DinB [Paenibacillus sp. PK3_47]|uniref:DinB family protein n=1 Tax=Paenibacillus sp. PK3_47 TaxID=2072642 RepID=UPI00201DE7ED|nr:DinB family protein [Paenibacillus sp. PK3_47]UQZ36225.1 damage-inducible protein DinB [Paenibacillus sp. PK3_47]
METMFRYNWMIREEWYKWCEQLSEEELLKPRTGGVGGILKTLFHIADVEWSWVMCMEGKPDFEEDFAEYSSLQQVRALDARFRPEVERFVLGWHEGLERNLLEDHYKAEGERSHAWGEIMRHMIAHEIHHIGQLSVWARELGRAPVSANLIRKGLAEFLPGKESTVG